MLFTSSYHTHIHLEVDFMYHSTPSNPKLRGTKSLSSHMKWMLNAFSTVISGLLLVKTTPTGCTVHSDDPVLL